MNDKDKWSAHLEYLKVSITLATAILAVSAAIYSDSGKIPQDWSRYILLFSALFVFITLVFSIVAVIKLCNYLIRDESKLTEAENQVCASKITWYSGGAFFGLIVTGFCILSFFAARSFLGAPGPTVSIDSAIENSSILLRKQIDTSKETLRLNYISHVPDKYLIEYSVMPSMQTSFSVSVNDKTGIIDGFTRKP